MGLQQWWSDKNLCKLQEVDFFVPGDDNYTLWVTTAPASKTVNKTKILLKPC